MPERSFYRIDFPRAERPKLEIDGCRFVVCNLSEEGIRYLLGSAPPPVPESRVQGVLELTDFEPVTIAGRVVWVRDGQVALHLDERRVPLRVILGEQLALRRRYAVWGDPFSRDSGDGAGSAAPDGGGEDGR